MRFTPFFSSPRKKIGSQRKIILKSDFYSLAADLKLFNQEIEIHAQTLNVQVCDLHRLVDRDTVASSTAICAPLQYTVVAYTLKRSKETYRFLKLRQINCFLDNYNYSQIASLQLYRLPTVILRNSIL